jgi:protein TonB
VLLALYPPTLRQAGVGGRVIAECVVGINGRVEPQSIRIAETTEELFGSATAVALPRLRFKPAQLAYRGKLVAVRMQVRIPVNWEIRY